MDDISDLPQLLAKTSITADPVPAAPAGKGKDIAPEKNQTGVKLPSGSKRPSDLEDIEFKEDDELPQQENPIPADLAGKSPSSSDHPIEADDVNDQETAENDDDL